MNSSAYIFGKFVEGCSQFPDNYAEGIFDKFQSVATAQSQIVVHRDKNMMYYGYVRKLDMEGQYLGMCVLLNDVMLTRMEKLFSLFEGIFAELVSKGELIKLNESGDVVAVVGLLNEKQPEVEHVIASLRDEMVRLEQTAVKLPPVDYSKAEDSCETFKFTDKNESIVEASSKYAYTCIQKDTEFDTPLLANLRAVLKKTAETPKTVEHNSSIVYVREKRKEEDRDALKKTLWIVGAVLLIVIVIMFVPKNCMNSFSTLPAADNDVEESVNTPQSLTETDEAEITEDLISAIHRYRDIEPFHNGYALVLHDSIDDGKVHFGYINMNGEEVVPCRYGIDAMEYFRGNPDGLEYKFENGLAPVVYNGKYGFVNTKGEEVIPCKYDFVMNFSEGMAAVAYEKGDGFYKWGYINTKGDEVIPCQYDIAHEFSEGLAEVLIGVESGFINTKGEVIIPFQIFWPSKFSDGLAVVMDDNKFKAINKKGEVVFCYHNCIPKLYEDNYFSEGLVAVQHDWKWGYVDTSGKEIIPCQYDLAKSFSNGLAAVGVGEDSWNGKYGFINTKGEEIVPCIYDDVENFSEGLAVVKRKEKYGFINTKGEEVIPCQYDRARSFSDGFAVVYLAYYDAIPPIKGLIDKKGNTTFTQEDWDEYEKWKRKKE